MDVWLVYKIRSDRYTVDVVLFGIATTDEEKDKFLERHRGSVAEKVPTDQEVLVTLAEIFTESPAW